MANEKGTGQHAHKSSEGIHITKRHRREESRAIRVRHPDQSASGNSGSSEKSGSSSSQSDLKGREYKDSEGNVHHHTHTAER